MNLEFSIPDVNDSPCPACGVGGLLRIEMRYEARPIGTFSLAGHQAKVSAYRWPYLVCGNCGAEAKGEIGKP